MPIVFVHGVNNRRDDGYRENEAGRNGFLREIVGPVLGLPKKTLKIFNPYWGGSAAKFAWHMAVLPDAKEEYEHFGTGTEQEALALTMALASEQPGPNSIVERARENFAGTIDLLYGALLVGAESEEEGRAAAASFVLAHDYAGRNPHPVWLDDEGVTDDNFADVLNVHISEDGEIETFGSDGFLDQLKEGLSRLGNVLPSAGTDLFVKTAREQLNARVARFAGDAFVYLKNRGTPDAPGTIVQLVMNALLQAESQKASEDDKLIVIAHSFGGEIVYDILTRYAPHLKIDVLVTVGSQVGLFEEMKLYIASDATIPANLNDKVKKPGNIGNWLNIFDTNDVLSFRIEPIFSDTHDLLYETGYSGLKAHAGYFLRPSFYTRMATRLSDLFGSR